MAKSNLLMRSIRTLVLIGMVQVCCGQFDLSETTGLGWAGWSAPEQTTEPPIEATTEPPEPEATTVPSEPEATTVPSEPEATTEPSEPEATTEPSEPEATTEPSEPEATTEEPTTEAPTTKAPTTTSSTTPGWGSSATSPGWGWPVPTGDTAAFGQVLAVQGLAGSNTQSNPALLEGNTQHGTMDMAMINTQQAEMNFETDSWTPGGGEAIVPGASAEVDGPSSSMTQEATLNTSVIFTGATAAGIIGDPQTSASMSVGSLVVSTSGQVSNGTDVNSGANNSGWGWNSQGSGGNKPGNGWNKPNGWSQGNNGPRVAQSSGWSSGNSTFGWGWSPPQEGQTASASSLETIENLSQQASASDDITAIAVSEDSDSPLGLEAVISAPIALDGEFNGNGVEATAGNANSGTSWQNLEYSSYPQNNQNLSVANADAIAISSQPNSTSFGAITISDWVTANSGSNLGSQNNGSWGSQGWGKPSQGWSIKPSQGWGAGKPSKSLKLPKQKSRFVMPQKIQ